MEVERVRYSERKQKQMLEQLQEQAELLEKQRLTMSKRKTENHKLQWKKENLILQKDVSSFEEQFLVLSVAESAEIWRTRASKEAKGRN